MKTILIQMFMIVSGIICLMLAGCNWEPVGEGKSNENIDESNATQADLSPESETPGVIPDFVDRENSPVNLESSSEPFFQSAPAVDSEIVLDIPLLNEQSSSADIQDRIAQSQSLWQSVWLEGMITWYPPKGEQTPPQVYRGQVWFDQSGMKFRSLIGSPGKDPSSAKISDGKTIFEFDPQSGNETSTNLPTFAKEGVNLAGIVGSPLSELLFSGSLAQRGGVYVPVASEKIAGRPALVVDWRSDGVEQPVDRFWVDAQTGVFLRMQHFGKAGGDVVSSDIEFTQVFYNLDFAKDLFQLPIAEFPVFQEDWSKVSEVPSQSFGGVQPAADMHSGEIYFNWFALIDGTQSLQARLMRISAACLVNNTPCPEAEAIANAPDSSASSESFPISLTWSPDGRRAAATLLSDESQQLVTKLFIYQPEGDNWSLLGEFDPIDEVMWSEDGQWISFQTNLNGFNLYTIQADGSDLRQLAAGMPITAADSSNERLGLMGWQEGRLYYDQTIVPNGNGYKIYSIQPGVGEAQLVREFSLAEVSGDFRMLPDGRFITLGYDDHYRYLNVISLGSENTRPLISFKKSYSLFSVSPNGQWVAFSLVSDPTSMDFSFDVFAVHPDGSDMRQLASFDGYMENMLFSPDSRCLLIHEQGELGQLYLISLDNGSQRLLQIPGIPLNDRLSQISWRKVSQ